MSQKIAKHTPGPWTVKPDAITLPERGVINAQDPEQGRIVVAWYNGVDEGAAPKGKPGVGPVSEANGRLLASAPALLAALKTIASWDPEAEDLEDPRTVARAAIAQAEGI